MNVFQFIEALDSAMVAHAQGKLSNENLTQATSELEFLFNGQPHNACIQAVASPSRITSVMVARFESSILGSDDKKAIVYRTGVDSFNVSYYVNDEFVYAVPQGFDTLEEACDDAQYYVRRG